MVLVLVRDAPGAVFRDGHDFYDNLYVVGYSFHCLNNAFLLNTHINLKILLFCLAYVSRWSPVITDAASSAQITDFYDQMSLQMK